MEWWQRTNLKERALQARLSTMDYNLDAMDARKAVMGEPKIPSSPSSELVDLVFPRE